MSARPALSAPSPTRLPAARRALARKLLADELPESLRPSAAHKRLQAALVWGEDEVLDVRDVAPGTPLTIGAKDAVLQVFHDVPCRGPLVLAAPVKDGHELLLPRGVPVRVRVDGAELDAESLVSKGLAHPQDVPVRGARSRLGLHDRATYSFGGVRLVVRYTRPEVIADRPFLQRIDASFVSWLAVLLLGAFTVERMMALSFPTAIETEGQLSKRNQDYIQHLVQTHPPPVVFHEPQRMQPPAPKAPLPEGKLGKPDAKQKQADRSRTAGPAVNTDKREHDQNVVKNAGLVALLAHGPATATLLSAGGLGGGLNEALGNVGHGGPGDVAGTGGLGTRGNGPGGGGTMNVGGPFGLHAGVPHGTSIDIGGGHHVERVPVAHVTVSPNCERDVIGGVIRRHWTEIRSCYEAELQKDPNLAGKVSVYFEIGPNGMVTVNNVQENSLGNEAAARCMLDRVHAWRFPEPKGGGVCAVTYPFLFSVASN